MKLAIILPALNEEASIAGCIEKIILHIPLARIVVVDNGSSDGTRALAIQALRPSDKLLVCNTPGKGAAVRMAVRCVEADYYCLIDADDTYSIPDLARCVDFCIENNCHLVIGNRFSSGAYKRENSRFGHDFGNKMITLLSKWILKLDFGDSLSGLRVMSKPFVSGLAVFFDGFELETEINHYAARIKCGVASLPIDYQERQLGSVSKLNSLKDGFKIIAALIKSAIATSPMQFILPFSGVLFISSVLLMIRPIVELIDKGTLANNYSGSFSFAAIFLALSLLLVISAYFVWLIDHNRRAREIADFNERCRWFSARPS